VNENQKIFLVPTRKSLELYLGHKILETNDSSSSEKMIYTQLF